MNNKVIFPIFGVLLLLAMIPFKFTLASDNFLFGWLPIPMAYWWTLMFINLAFVLCVSRHFVKTSEREGSE